MAAVMELLGYIFLILCASSSFTANDQYSNTRHCVDDKCSKPISIGKAQINYVPGDANGIHLRTGDTVEIIAKECNKKDGIWLVKVKDKIGYVPSDRIREEKAVQKPMVCVPKVPTKENVQRKEDISAAAAHDKKAAPSQQATETIKNGKVSQPAAVVPKEVPDSASQKPHSSLIKPTISEIQTESTRDISTQNEVVNEKRIDSRISGVDGPSLPSQPTKQQKADVISTYPPDESLQTSDNASPPVVQNQTPNLDQQKTAGNKAEEYSFTSDTGVYLKTGNTIVKIGDVKPTPSIQASASHVPTHSVPPSDLNSNLVSSQEAMPNSSEMSDDHAGSIPNVTTQSESTLSADANTNTADDSAKAEVNLSKQDNVTSSGDEDDEDDGEVESEEDDGPKSFSEQVDGGDIDDENGEINKKADVVEPSSSSLFTILKKKIMGDNMQTSDTPDQKLTDTLPSQDVHSAPETVGSDSDTQKANESVERRDTTNVVAPNVSSNLSSTDENINGMSTSNENVATLQKETEKQGNISNASVSSALDKETGEQRVNSEVKDDFKEENLKKLKSGDGLEGSISSEHTNKISAQSTVVESNVGDKYSKQESENAMNMGKPKGSEQNGIQKESVTQNSPGVDNEKLSDKLPNVPASNGVKSADERKKVDNGEKIVDSQQVNTTANLSDGKHLVNENDKISGSGDKLVKDGANEVESNQKPASSSVTENKDQDTAQLNLENNDRNSSVENLQEIGSNEEVKENVGVKLKVEENRIQEKEGINNSENITKESISENSTDVNNTTEESDPETIHSEDNVTDEKNVNVSATTDPSNVDAKIMENKEQGGNVGDYADSTVKQEPTEVVPQRSSPDVQNIKKLDLATDSNFNLTESDLNSDTDSDGALRDYNDTELEKTPLKDDMLFSDDNQAVSEGVDEDNIQRTVTKSDDAIGYHSNPVAGDENEKSESVITEEGQSSDTRNDDASGIKSLVQVLIDLFPEWLRVHASVLEHGGVSPRVVILTLISGVLVTVLIISLFAAKTRSAEFSLAVKLCHLDQKLFSVTTEKNVIKEELDLTKGKLSKLEQNLLESRRSVSPLQEELEYTRRENVELKNTITSLEEELGNATEAGLELNRMLSDFLTSQNQNDSLQVSVEALQDQLDSQRGSIVNLQTSLEFKTNENKDLKSTIEIINNENLSLKNELEQIKIQLEASKNSQQVLTTKADEKNELNDKLGEENAALNSKLHKLELQLPQLAYNVGNYKETCEKLKMDLSYKNSEIDILKETMMKLKMFEEENEDENVLSEKWDRMLEQLLDAAKVTADLKSVIDDRELLSIKYKTELDARMTAEDEIEKMKLSVISMESSMGRAMKEKQEAETRLEILSKYFKEKETQLQKELGIQEAKVQQSSENAESAGQKASEIGQSAVVYKSQVGSLKKQMEEIERSHKSQMLLQEKKAHENWMAAKEAERKLDAMKTESAVLRNRLTLVEQVKASLLATVAQNDSLQKSKTGQNGDLMNSIHVGTESVPDGMVTAPSPMSQNSNIEFSGMESPHGRFIPVDGPALHPFHPHSGMPMFDGPPPPFGMPPMLPMMPPPPFDPHSPPPFERHLHGRMSPPLSDRQPRSMSPNRSRMSPYSDRSRRYSPGDRDRERMSPASDRDSRISNLRRKSPHRHRDTSPLSNRDRRPRSPEFYDRNHRSPGRYDKNRSPPMFRDSRNPRYSPRYDRSRTERMYSPPPTNPDSKSTSFAAPSDLPSGHPLRPPPHIQREMKSTAPRTSSPSVNQGNSNTTEIFQA